MDRAKSDRNPRFRTIRESARGRSRDGYFVALLRAGDLMAADIAIRCRPTDDNPGHVELPQLHAENRRSNEARELKEKLRTLCLKVEGPFDPDGNPKS